VFLELGWVTFETGEVFSGLVLIFWFFLPFTDFFFGISFHVVILVEGFILGEDGVDFVESFGVVEVVNHGLDSFSSLGDEGLEFLFDGVEVGFEFGETDIIAADLFSLKRFADLDGVFSDYGFQS